MLVTRHPVSQPLLLLLCEHRHSSYGIATARLVRRNQTNFDRPISHGSATTDQAVSVCLSFHRLYLIAVPLFVSRPIIITIPTPLTTPLAVPASVAYLLPGMSEYAYHFLITPRLSPEASPSPFLIVAFPFPFPQAGSEALSVAIKVDGGAKKEAAPKGGLRGLIPTKSERKKLIPLAGMFFCILFNYTILRDTKVLY